MPLLIMYLCNLRIEYLVRNESDQGLTGQSVTKLVPKPQKEQQNGSQSDAIPQQ